jgi:hypothetical protein
MYTTCKLIVPGTNPKATGARWRHFNDFVLYFFIWHQFPWLRFSFKVMSLGYNSKSGLVKKVGSKWFYAWYWRFRPSGGILHFVTSNCFIIIWSVCFVCQRSVTEVIFNIEITIFCQNLQSVGNTHWKRLPFRPAKGDRWENVTNRLNLWKNSSHFPNIGDCGWICAQIHKTVY